LHPGETRAVGLAGVPGEATSALVLITTREATKRGKLRIGLAGEKKPAATFRFPKRGVRSAVMVVPVAGGRVSFVTSKSAGVHLRVEVLGYAIHGKPISVRGLSPTPIAKAKLDAGVALVLGPVTGVGGVPRKKKPVTGVILQIRTKGRGPDGGSLKAYGLDRSPPGTRSAPIVPRKWYTSLVVAEIGTDGKIVLTPSVNAKIRATIVGYVHR
jgi:hypothetical protein